MGIQTGKSFAGSLFRLFIRLAHRVYQLRLWITRPLTVGVRLVLLRQGESGPQVLLVRHTYHDGWLLPGGGVEKGETIEAAARREAREELGVEMAYLRLLGVYTNFYEHKSDHVIVFASDLFSLPEERVPGLIKGGVSSSLEVDTYAFFPLDALPTDLLPGHRRRLEELKQERPAGFGMW